MLPKHSPAIVVVLLVVLVKHERNCVIVRPPTNILTFDVPFLFPIFSTKDETLDT